jgi:hypothetical protein
MTLRIIANTNPSNYSCRACGRLFFWRSAPAGLMRTNDWPLAEMISTNPREFDSSQTANLGHEVRHASIVSWYVRSVRASHSRRSRTRFSMVWAMGTHREYSPFYRTNRSDLIGFAPIGGNLGQLKKSFIRIELIGSVSYPPGSGYPTTGFVSA